MNVLGLMAGDIVGTIGTELASKVIDKLMPSKSPKFLDAFKQQTFNEAQKLNVEDLNLSKDEELALANMQEYAQSKGMTSLEVEIQGKHYQLNTKDMSLIPILSSSSQ